MGLEDTLRCEARRQALLKLGGLDQVTERWRDRRGLPGLESLWRDVRGAARASLRTPGLTAVIVGSLALGIGANVAVFSLLDRVLLRPLPVADPERLVQLAIPDTRETCSYPVREEIARRPDVIDAFAWSGATFAGAAAVLTVVGLAASWWPARRAARTDPTESLRAA